MQEKINQIKKAIAQKGSAIIAFSGGVDSATIAALAYEALGENALAITAESEIFPERELKAAVSTAREIGILHRIVHFDELDEHGFAENTRDRCYHCKKGLLYTLIGIADKEGINVVLEGTNASEILGHRPGRNAIVEAGQRVFTPFTQFGVTKDEVRHILQTIWLVIIRTVIRNNFLLLIHCLYVHKFSPSFPSNSLIKSIYSLTNEMPNPVANDISCSVCLLRNAFTRL